jgi:GntR family transcriptional regulator
MPKKENLIYFCLADTIAEQISQGKYPAGSLLPSEREICTQHDVSRTTVRRALQELTRNGYIHTVYGKGWAVVGTRIQQEISNIYSFDEDMRRLGKNPETKVVDFVLISAPPNLVKLFAIPEGGLCYRIIRLRMADGEPMLLETNFLPHQRFKNVERSEIEQHSLYKYLGETYGFHITKAEETFEPVRLTALESRLLLVETDTLAMMIERIAYEGNRVVEFSKSVSPSYRFRHHIVLSSTDSSG